MRKDVATKVSHRRKQAIAARNKATSIAKPCFVIGNHVSTRRTTGRGHSLQYKWFDPLCIDQIHSLLV